MLRHNYITCLFYQAKYPSFFKILQYDYYSQALHYLFQYTVLTYIIYIFFMSVTKFLFKLRPRNLFSFIFLNR